MIRRRAPRLVLIALAAFGVTLLWAPPAMAATAPGAVQAPSADNGSGDPDDDALVWSVRPSDAVGTGRPNFGYRADPGASVQDSLDVTNRGDASLTLRVYAADAFTPQGGGIDLLRDTRKSRDVGSWISLGTASITVEPQETVAVPFTLAVPPQATPGDHAGGIVTTYTTGSGPLAVERRLGSRVLVRVSGELAPKLTLSRIAVDYGTQFNPFSPSTATVTYTVANTGNVRVDAHPTVTITGPFGMLGRAVATEDLGELLPGSSRHFQVRVPAVWAFLYLAGTVRLEPFPSNPADSASALGLEPISARTAAFGLNWGQAILFVLLGLAVIAGLWWRRRSNAKVQAAIDGAVEKALAETAHAAREPAR